MDTVIQGDYQRSVPDPFVGATPDISRGQAGDVVARVQAGTAYVVAALRGSFVQLRSAHVSPAL